jgi:hypothetical protein
MRQTLTHLLIVGLLTGCGGGGTDPIPTPATDIAQFTGVWLYTDPAYDLCYPNYNGGTLANTMRYGPIQNTNIRQNTYYYYYYSDANCSNFIGYITDTCELTWSAPPSDLDPTNSVRMKCTNYTRTFTGDTPEVPIDPSFVYQDIWQIRNNTMYTGDFNGPFTSDGYPAQLLPDSTYTKWP